MCRENIKILIATHKKYKMPESSIYLPIHVGKEGKKDLGYIGDNSGDNISKKNESFCEVTALYWAWKNLDIEYIGLNHYRRYFTKKGIFQRILNKNKYELILDENSIRELIKKYDVILPRKRNYFIETVWSQYKNAHNIRDLEETRKIVEDKYPEYLISFDRVMNDKKLHLYNMFIMRKKDFDDYCEWLFDILFELENRIDISQYNNYQRRVFGFISERLFNVWLDYKNCKKVELDIIHIERINWIRKIISFLKRKFLS